MVCLRCDEVRDLGQCDFADRLRNDLTFDPARPAWRSIANIGDDLTDAMISPSALKAIKSCKKVKEEAPARVIRSRNLLFSMKFTGMSISVF